MKEEGRVVLGAGIAGLGAFYGDNEVDIYEASGKPGGLCSSFQIGDFCFDQAVHLSFSKNPTVRELFDRTSQYVHVSSPYSWFCGKWFRHPAQNNLFPLLPEEKTEAIKGFIQKKGCEKSENFAQWLSDGYGEFLYKKLFQPYNQKYWCTDLEKIGVEWISNRIYQPTLDEVLMGTYTDKIPNTYYATKMYYPIGGGYYKYLKKLSEEAIFKGKLHLHKEAVKIDIAAKTVCFSDGSEVVYDKLYSSIPLPEMLQIIEETPQKVREKAELLEFTGVALVSMGLGACKTEKLWFYVYDADIMAARAYMPSVKSCGNVPEGHYSIQFEIYFNGKHSHAPEEHVAVQNCIYALEKMGIACADDILFTDYRVIPYGNVICLKQTEKDLPEIADWLKSIGITPIGRFGRWEYLWSDQAFLSGYEAVSK